MDRRKVEPKVLRIFWMISKEKWHLVQIRMQKKKKKTSNLFCLLLCKSSLFLVIINSTIKF